VLRHGKPGKADMKNDSGKVQWDPERSVRMGKLDYRSIQIGIPGDRVQEYLEGIVRIDDVTGRARELKRVMDEEGRNEDMGKGKSTSMEEFIERGLVPLETEYVVDKELRVSLSMNGYEDVE
jgi:hypothetical protein